MTKMKEIIELLQQVKNRKNYEVLVEEFDRINVCYLKTNGIDEEIYFINKYNNLINKIKCCI
jgi:hypothetical protein